MSRSKHQTLKSIIDGQSKPQVDTMFAEKDSDAMEWVEKRVIKKEKLRSRRAAKNLTSEG
jgi:hypothetical protein